ncbi:MAG: hypothetical protein LPK24_03375 [Marinobacter sp.]|uniref:hypothetical protein n=1 Tax=Marinobacter sp. TaxID=50741 RepID=UPI0029C590FD|nr:hypothetical protein [Marinobacter sp.]MDX5385553.1 hypothetical protein [Marinobacter sp.]
MISQGKLAGMLAMIMAGTLVTGCGGGSGGGGGGGGGLTLLSGLDGDADNHDILYFSGNYEADGKSFSTLYGVNPAVPGSIFAQHLTVAEDARSPEELGRVLYRPLYEAVIDDTDGSVQDYRVSDVLFLHNRENGNTTSEGFARASTDGPLNNQMGVPFSNVPYADAPSPNSTGVIVRENYVSADNVEIAYGAPGSKKHIRITASTDDGPTVPITGIFDYIGAQPSVGSTATSYRYIALREDDLTQCGGYFITSAFTSATGSSGYGTPNLLPEGVEVAYGAKLGPRLGNNKQYLILKTYDQADCSTESSVWVYDANMPSATALLQVRNFQDEPLLIPTGAAGGPMLPQQRHIATTENGLYFGITGALDFSPQNIYRLQGNYWHMLAEQEENLGHFTGFIVTTQGRVAASVGNSVASWTIANKARMELDTSSAAWQGIMSDVLGSRDGWFFYNRADITGRDYAVAMRFDGSDSREIPDAQWFGASITGNGPHIHATNELSEVFFWRGRDIGAVSAADPTAGMVVLGRLPAKPDNVVMYGMAPGPHRLIQVYPEGESEGRVYYVNTRNADSLRAMDVGSPVGHQRPVDGF